MINESQYQLLLQLDGIEDDLPTRPELLPFEESREFVRFLEIKSQTEWREYCKSGKKPNNIPSNPNQVYKDSGWISLGDWLGTGTVATRNREFLPFEESRKFVRSLKLKSETEWRKYCKSGNKPDNVPVNPNEVYKDSGWISMGDWLGTGRIAHKYRTFLPFEESREFIHLLKLKSETEWKEYRKSGNKPDNIPAHPWKTYKDSGWISLGDWLGTGTVASRNREYLPFEESREFVHSLNLKTQKEWREYCKSGNKPDNIPAQPWEIYKDSGWASLGDWLGTGRIAHKYRTFLPFEESREFVHSLKLKSFKEWNEYSKSGKRPDNIPTNPYTTYKDSGWVSWGDWLGTGTVASQNREYLPFEESREFVHSLNLKTQKEWRKYCKSGNKPDNVPACPNQVYKDSGWISMGDWLGK